jgi:alpha-beta hydrolase superfamily lysophospholipase
MYGRPAADTRLREHFSAMMRARGAHVPFERFEAASIISGGLRLHLDVIDVAAEAPTVVFIPGTAVYGLAFGDLLDGLAQGGCNVVSVDLRGHGRSDGERGDYTIPLLVEDARAAVEYARRRFRGPIFAIGSSQGGIVGLYLAATDAPVAGVICHNAADLSDPELLRHMGKPAVLGLLRPVLAAAARRFPTFKLDIRRYLNLLLPGRSQVKDFLATDPFSTKVITLRALASLSSAPLARPVEAITTPVMFVAGGRDTIFPLAFTESLFDRLRCDKQLKVYRDRGHFLFTSKVDRVLPDMLAWIKR